MAHPNVAEIGLLANTVRERLHPVERVTYNIGRNINYTNVCWVKCDFCAFYRAPGSDEGWTIPKEQIFEKIDELVRLGGDEVKSNEILMQGGLNPKLKIDYYEDLFFKHQGEVSRDPPALPFRDRNSLHRTCFEVIA